jgi:hypothetical protein
MNPLISLGPCRVLDSSNPFVAWPRIALICGIVLLVQSAALWLGRKTIAQPRAGRLLAIASVVLGIWALVLAGWSANEAATWTTGCVTYVASWPIDESSALGVTVFAVVATAALTAILLVVGLLRLRARQQTVRLP